MSLSIEFLQVGCTHHLLKMVSMKSPAVQVSFPATVALLHHERFGPILFDTGYSPRFYEVTKTFPEKLYALTTPVDILAENTLVEQLKRRGIQPTDIQSIILSHFHADHIGGVSDFPTAKYIYLKHAYESLHNISRFRAVLFNGFLKKLLPADFTMRSVPFTITEKNCSKLDYNYFSYGYDILGDGSIMAIELPGHAQGHLGLMIYADTGVYFLVGDACWVRENYLEDSKPHWLVRQLVLHDTDKYYLTLQKLKHFNSQYPEVRVIPCHCNKSLTDLKNPQHIGKSNNV